jgi:hypothetical protein
MLEERQKHSQKQKMSRQTVEIEYFKSQIPQDFLMQMELVSQDFVN